MSKKGSPYFTNSNYFKDDRLVPRRRQLADRNLCLKKLFLAMVSLTLMPMIIYLYQGNFSVLLLASDPYALFDSCWYYNVSTLERSSGVNDSSCDRIPSVFCGNDTTCDDVYRNVRPSVLCEIGKNFEQPTDYMRLCAPKKIVYTCEMLNESSLPCAKDYVVEELDYHTQFHCLFRIAKSLSTAHRVPPIHHQVWYFSGRREMEFYEYIALLSHLRFFQPKAVFIWNNGYFPTNRWWQEVISHLNQETSEAFIHINEQTESRGSRKVAVFKTKLYSVRRIPPVTIYDLPISYVQHKSDITRLEAVLMFGGFYADVDTISLRSHDPLMQYPVTMGLEGPTSLTNMAIFAQAHAPHLYNWHYSYASFDNNSWSEWSIQRNFRMAKRCPHLVHIEPVNMATPNWEVRSVFATDNMDLSESYTTHLYWRYIDHSHLTSPDVLQRANHLAHRIFRGIYYNLCEVCG